jgi:DNA ligase (NAD+)
MNTPMVGFMTNTKTLQQAKAYHDELVGHIRAWDHEYYMLAAPTATDAKYDEIFRQLKELEKEYPQLVTPESPTQKVSGKVSSKLKSIKHVTPMLSLYTETDYGIAGAESFLHRVKDIILKQGLTLYSDMSFTAEPKYDGLAVDLKYHNGKLVQALTRGDGEEGEDVTHNAMLIESIPHFIFALPEHINIRGEVMMTKKEFTRLNDQLQVQGEKLLVNPRNAAAGALRLLNTKKAAERKLTFFAYGLADLTVVLDGGTGIQINTQWDLLNQFKLWGFNVSKEAKVFVQPTADTLYGFHQEIARLRKDLEYDIDGVVYKVNDLALQQTLGAISREPRWAVAHKYKPEEALSTIRTITTEVGRTGKLTPVAQLDPIFVGGVEVSNATLHNQFDIRKRGVRVGDTVTIRRAGDVIPEIVPQVRLNGLRRPYVPNYRAPKFCPSCGSGVYRKRGEANSFCSNEHSCPSQYLAYLLHYVSRSVMDIKGVGEKRIAELYSKGLLPTPAAFFILTEEVLISLGWGEKESENFINAIASKKEIKLSTFIYSLGIPGVGANTSKQLANHLGDFFNFANADMQTLLSIADIGPGTALAIINWLSNKGKIKRMFELLNVGIAVLPAEIQKVTSQPLKGRSFVLTGSFDSPGREAIAERLKDLGAKVGSSVSKNTTAVISGFNPTVHKLEKARSLNVPINDATILASLIGTK